MNKILLTLLFFLAIQLGYAQDIHFSNYNAQPLLLNPATTGLNGCDYRLGANFRTQWFSVSEGNTYRTASVFGDFALGKPTKFSNFAGLGVSFYSDQAGDLNYNTNKVDVSLAYHIMLAKRAKQSISFGLQGGFAHRGLDQSKALFAFDPFTGEPVPTEVENIDNVPMFYGDAGIGFLYSASPKDNSNYYFGIGLQHLSQPNISGFTINQDANERLYMKATFHGGSQIPLSDHLYIMPGFMILKQGPSSEFTITNFFKFKPSTLPSNRTAFYFGTMYRVSDAVILAARADFGGVNLHFSYDLNISKLTSASRANGGPEVALVYVGCFNRKNNDRFCPAF